VLTQLLGLVASAGAFWRHQAQVPADSHPVLHALSIKRFRSPFSPAEPAVRRPMSSWGEQHQSICMFEHALRFTGYVSSQDLFSAASRHIQKNEF